VAAALLALLGRALEEAVFVSVFAAVFFDACVLEGAEDGVGTVVFGEVIFVLCEL
jgi:hypothetical protein